MRLAHADGAGEQQAGAGGLDWVALDELARAQVGGGQRAIGPRKALS